MQQRFGLLLLLTALLVSCTENPAAPPPESQALAEQPSLSPYHAMGVERLREEVRKANGLVSINLKAPGAARGVSPAGTVLLDRANERAAKSHLRGLGLKFEREFKYTPTVVVTLPDALVGVVRRLPFVESIEPVTEFEIQADSRGAAQSQTTPWGVDRLQSQNAWYYTRGAGVRALIIDTGVHLGHPDLNVAANKNCTNYAEGDNFGHGTHVAGTVAAVDNTSGVVGVGPDVSLYIAKAGNEGIGSDAVICAIEWGRSLGVFVTNMSFGDQIYRTDLANSIRSAYQAGMLFVGATGNNSSIVPVAFPANLDEVIAVSATTQGDGLASFSNTGPEVELAAPGEAILSTSVPGGGHDCMDGDFYAYCSGTSMAAPHVTAVAALIKAQFPSLTRDEVRSRLHGSARDLGPAGRDDSFGYGRIEAYEAVLPPFVADISGPMCLYSGGFHGFSASASGGIPPYTYTWYRDRYSNGGFKYAGTGSSKSLYYDWGNYGETLKVVVNDASGLEWVAYKQVYMNSEDGPPTVTAESDRDGEFDPSATVCD